MRLFKSRKQGRASRVNITPPAANAVQAPLAVCAIFKNEARHLADWLRFHGIAGVRDFILYDNGSTDDSAAIARSIVGLNVLVIPWRFNGIVDTPPVFLPQQILAYCHAIANFGPGFHRMAFIDIDEVLVPKQAYTLPQALEHIGDVSNVSLPWVMFGPNGHDMPPDDPAMLAYTTRGEVAPGPLLNFKCIVDPTRVTQVSIHKFVTADLGSSSVNDQGFKAHHYRARSRAGFLSTDHIQLNHYYTRSVAEMQTKITKGAVSGVSPDTRAAAIRTKVDLIAKTEQPDLAAPDFLARHGVTNGNELRSYDFTKVTS